MYDSFNQSATEFLLFCTMVGSGVSNISTYLKTVVSFSVFIHYNFDKCYVGKKIGVWSILIMYLSSLLFPSKIGRIFFIQSFAF